MALEDDVNKALVVAGNKGRYQFIVMFLLCVIFYFDVFLLLGPSFYFMDPTFICEGSEEVVDEKEACPRITECYISKLSKYSSKWLHNNQIHGTLLRSARRKRPNSIVIVNWIFDRVGTYELPEWFEGEEIGTYRRFDNRHIERTMYNNINLVTILGAYA